MNFTREPIIETIITPKEGYKLIVRNSKGESEEYSVDALEVVSFGSAIFYRSLDRTKAFLLPVSDYEVVESKEARLVIKNAPIEKSVKIGGGKEAPKVAPKEAAEEKPLSVKDKRERRRTRRRRGGSEALPTDEKKVEKPVMKEWEGGGAEDETKVSSSMFSSLLRPPPQLISEKINRSKDKELSQGDFFSEQVSETVPFKEVVSDKQEVPLDELTPEREKNQPLFPTFIEEEHFRISPPPPLVTLPPQRQEEKESDSDDYIF